MPRPRTLPMVNLGSETVNPCVWGCYLGLRSRLSMMVVCWYPRWSHLHQYGLQALVVPQQQSADEPTCGIRAGSLSLGTPPPPRCWWFVVCGTLTRHPRNGCLSFRALRTERCPRFPAVFAWMTPRAACATRTQPHRAWCVRVQRVPARRWVNRK